MSDTMIVCRIVFHKTAWDRWTASNADGTLRVTLSRARFQHHTRVRLGWVCRINGMARTHPAPVFRTMEQAVEDAVRLLHHCAGRVA